MAHRPVTILAYALVLVGFAGDRIVARLRHRGGQGPGTVVFVQLRRHVAKVRDALAIQRLSTRVLWGSNGDEGRRNDSDDDKDCGHRNGSRDGHDVGFGGSIVSK